MNRSRIALNTIVALAAIALAGCSKEAPPPPPPAAPRRRLSSWSRSDTWRRMTGTSRTWARTTRRRAACREDINAKGVMIDGRKLKLELLAKTTRPTRRPALWWRRNWWTPR